MSTPGGLWHLAAQRRQTAGRVPADRWDADRLAALHDPDLARRAGYGCFLEGDVRAWEPEAFSVAPIERRWVDPQFRVLMEVAWQAVEHAGLPMDRVRGSRTGVYMGTYAPDNLFRDARPVEDAPNSPYLFGNFTAGAAGRVAFSMDLRGPAMVISTHCSSGLVALDTACAALTLGECDIALAGAVLLMLSPETHYYEAPLLLSDQGACFAFDSRADGYVRGEGAGVLVLKRLTDARRDGDRALAVIRGSAVNNDGQASRLTAPSTEVQRQLFRQTVANADIDPGDVGLVEAHGPGTAVGDPVEYASINAVYGAGRGRCALGSVKTNIGHSEPVSGIAGVIKAVESLRCGLIPPNATFHKWNHSIPRDPGSRLFVPTELTPWPVTGDGRLAAVCSYGVTGTNAHVVLESVPTPLRPTTRTRSVERQPRETRLFLLSATSPQTLKRVASRLADWVDGVGFEIPLADVAHTLALRRSHADHRLGIIAGDHAQLVDRARAFAAGYESEGVVVGTPSLPPQHGGPVFVFTGQGSQRHGMCQGMLANDPVFAAVVDQLEPLIRVEAGFSLREMILDPDQLVGLARIQPTLFAVQVALAAVWRSWGIEPEAVIGQSLGEVAAMVVAGGLSPADGARVICRRSALLTTISGGAMASVLLGAEQVQAAIEASGVDGVSVGVHTSPGMTVISGDAAQIASLIGWWDLGGVAATLIDVDVASHSPQVDPILGALRSALAEVPAARPRIPFYSTVSADPMEPGLLDGAYWVRNQREPVLFHGAVSAALRQGHRLFIECTAHPLAVRPILDTARHEAAPDAVAVGSLRQGADDLDAFLSHLGAVHAAGFGGIDFAAHYGDGLLVDVPVTDWHRTRHGDDDPAYRLVAPHLPGAQQHPLLGGHVQDPGRPERHLWQTPLGPRLLPWLADHRVADVPVLPGTGLVEMMLAAAVRVFGSEQVIARDVTLLHPLVLDAEPVVTTCLTRDGDTAIVEIVSTGDGGTTVHARGIVRPLSDHERPNPLTDDEGEVEGWQDIEPAALHRIFRDRHGVTHGLTFTALDRIRVHSEQDHAVSWLRTHDSAQVSAWMMCLHPALTDQVVQTAVAAWLAHYTLTPGPVVVAGFDEVKVYGRTAHVRRAAVHVHTADDLGCTASARLATADGTVVAEMCGLRVSNITPPGERFAARLLHHEWVPAPTPEHRFRAVEGTWTVLTTAGDDWPADLARELNTQTAGCRTLPLTAALADPCVVAPSAGVVLAVGDEPTEDGPCDSARAVISGVVKLVGQLSRWEPTPRLWVLAPVSSRSAARLSAAALRGLLRTAAYEHPMLLPSYLEFDPQTPFSDIADELLDAEQPVSETALCSGERHVTRVLGGPGCTPPPAAAPTSPVRQGAAYLVTGGLGGLGLLTVDWLARLGAGRVVISSRREPSPQVHDQLDTLRAAGSEITLIQGDIATPRVAAQAVEHAQHGGMTLRGVLHAAGVVEDAILANLDERVLSRVWRGKAEGAWQLHLASEGLELDFFVLYSSMASLIGSPGQAAYAAANGFLDGLVSWRHRLGLPATGINWGAWAKVGRGRHLAERGFVTITAADGIDALERILALGPAQIAYSPLDIAHWTTRYRAVQSSVLLGHLLDDEQPDGEQSALRDELQATESPSARREILEEFIIQTVRELLGGTARHIGRHTSMVILGLDSLGAVQLQQRLQDALGTELAAGVIWVRPSAAGLADWLMDHMGFTGD